MGEKDMSEASHSIEGIDKRLEIPRRIDQPVAVRMLHEETVRPERLFRIEAAVVDIPFNREREVGVRGTQEGVVRMFGPDRPGRAGEQRAIGLPGFQFGGRLMSHCRIFSYFFETRRSQLSAGITIDTGGIDIEVAGSIRIQSFTRVSHSELACP
jgi:hypothetical protein